MGRIVNGIDEAVMEPGRPLEERGYPGFNPRQVIADGLTIDYDVGVKLRDGVTIYADVYRPAGVVGPLPTIVLWSAYGKHYRWPRPVLTAFTQGATESDYAPIEAPDPVTWCPAGYAIVVPDPRGINASEGDATAWSPQEGDDIHDTIEWIAEQPWSNGKAGMAGASYFGIVQWFAGATRPPHLAALLPYDGMSDLYREIGFHGGIPNPGFVNLVNFYYITRFTFGHAAHGWLRVSHRELDETRSKPFQPFHPHRREEPLEPGEIVPVEIEIWPSSTIFRSGETMRVVVMGKDPFPPTDAPGVGIAFHPDTRNAGRHVVHTGGRYDSHILMPVIPT